jgi:hypothetical protein
MRHLSLSKLCEKAQNQHFMPLLHLWLLTKGIDDRTDFRRWWGRIRRLGASYVEAFSWLNRKLRLTQDLNWDGESGLL